MCLYQKVYQKLKHFKTNELSVYLSWTLVNKSRKTTKKKPFEVLHKTVKFVKIHVLFFCKNSQFGMKLAFKFNYTVYKVFVLKFI